MAARSPCAGGTPFAAALRARVGAAPIVCALNALPLRILELLVCTLPDLVLHSFTNDVDQQRALSRLLPGGHRATPFHTALFGLFDGTGYSPANASCDVVVVNADQQTAEARQGVVFGLTQALGLARSGANAIVVVGSRCLNASFLIGGTCFVTRVPVGGKGACRRPDCIVREPCALPEWCWRDVWSELAQSKWLLRPECSEETGPNSQLQCLATASFDSVCSRSAPLLDGIVPMQLSWRTPRAWRRKMRRSAHNESVAGMALLLRQMRYVSAVPCDQISRANRSVVEHGYCLIFKDSSIEGWVGVIRSLDGQNFKGAPELVLPSTWPAAKAIHNLAMLYWNATYYIAGGRDRGCLRANRACREKGIWMAKSSSWRYLTANASKIPSEAAFFPRRWARQFGRPGRKGAWEDARLIIAGRHPGCVERRDRARFSWLETTNCEFDGRLSLVHFRGRFLLYARANLGKHGQRFVQVTQSSDGVRWTAPFEPVHLRGYSPSNSADIYFFAVSESPVHDSLVAIFPLVHNGRGCICISVSRDGVTWSTARPLLRCGSFRERATSHPAAGLILRDTTVLLYVQENVPDVHVDATTPLPHRLANENVRRNTARLVRYDVPSDLLRQWTIDGLCEDSSNPSACAIREARAAKVIETAFCPVRSSLASSPRQYEPARMLGAARQLVEIPRQQRLRGQEPFVLKLKQPAMRLDLALESIRSPPRTLNWACQSVMLLPRLMNPSIIRAPSTLASRCTYVLSARADTLHQCDATGATSNGRSGTVVALLDADLRVLSWAWLRWRTLKGTLLDSPAPWWDLRLILVDDYDEVFASYSCTTCSADVRISRIYIERNTSAQGTMAAWAFKQPAILMSLEPWQNGRNQVGWVYVPEAAQNARGVRPLPVLMVAPFLHAVATFGAIRKGRQKRPRPKQLALSVAHPRDRPLYARSGKLTLQLNDSARLSQQLAAGIGLRLSQTAHLVPIRSAECRAYLGVGHMHRGAADADQRAWSRAAYGYGPRPNRTFRWGYDYMHFFYVLEPDPPFRMVATSGEFCVGSQQDEDDCESIQFVSGLAPRAPLEADGASPNSFAPVHLLIAYGVNDCEARVGSLPLEQIWRSLVPLDGASGPCFTMPAGL